MRLIDADAVLSIISRKISEPQYMHDGEDWADGLTSAETIIERMPTVDAVKHGHWVDVNGPVISCKCSTCDAEYFLYEDDIYGYPYCAKCGAKMDGERKEE